MFKTILKLVFYAATFIALGAAAAYLFYQIKGYDDITKVPLLVGKNLSEATELLNKERLLINIEDNIITEEVEEGHIMKQGVPEGKRVRAGTAIGVIVSKRAELYTMPSFEGQLLEDAKLTMVNLGIQAGKITEVHSESVETGKIIAQRPLPGNMESNEINFLVSKGPYDVSYKCPSFVNMTINDARNLAKELGIELKEKERGSKVIFQNPEPDSIIKRGSTVEITRGRGWGSWF